MTRRARSLALLAALLAALAASCARPALLPDPTLAEISPARVPADGATITLTGSDFFQIGATDPMRVRMCGIALDAALVDGSDRTVVLPPSRTLRVAWSDELTATFEGGARVGRSDVAVTRPDGKRVVLEDAVECYDPAPVVTDLTVNGGGHVGSNRPARFAFTVRSPGGAPLVCALDPGDGGAPVAIAPCEGETTVEHTYAEIGSYTAELIVRDGLGRVHEQRVPVEVANTAPTAVLRATPAGDDGQLPLRVEFDGADSSDPNGDALEHAWDFGDGATAAGATAEHTYTAPGSYTASLTVADPFGATHTATVTVQVRNTAPVAAIRTTRSDPEGLFPLTVAFDASGSTDANGDALEYAWSFGDGATATGVATERTFETPGDFPVTLTVTDPHGATATARVVIGAANAAPRPSFTLVPDDAEGTLELAVRVDASGSTDPNGDALEYAWSFGDGGTATGATATHTYVDPGTFTVTLTASDPHGGTARATETVLARNPAPIAGLTATPDDPGMFAPLAVSFDASASIDPNGTPLEYAWTFGDGATATGATADHTYVDPGTYTVALTVTDAHDATDTVTRSVAVLPAEGSLAVTVTGLPADADPVDLRLVGPDGFELDIAGGGTFPEIPEGAYAIESEGASDGTGDYEAVLPAGGVTIVPGETTEVTVPFELILGHVAFEVDGLPADLPADVTLSGPSGERTVTATTTLEDLEPGEYLVTMGEVVDGGSTYAPAESSFTVRVRSGETAEATGTYVLQDGRLRVDSICLPPGSSPSYTVEGPSYSDDFSRHATIDLAPGAYTVASSGATGPDDGDYTGAPATQAVEVRSDELATATIAYTPPGGPRTITGSDDEGDSSGIDLLAMRVTCTATTIDVTLDFAAAPDLPSLGRPSATQMDGHLYLDTDLDTATGAYRLPGVGADYHVDFGWRYDDGSYGVNAGSHSFRGYAGTTVDGSSLTLRIPLPVIADDGIAALYADIYLDGAVVDQGPDTGAVRTD